MWSHNTQHYAFFRSGSAVKECNLIELGTTYNANEVNYFCAGHRMLTEA